MTGDTENKTMRQFQANLQVVSKMGSHFPSPSHSFCLISLLEHGKSAATLQVSAHTDSQIYPTYIAYCTPKKPTKTTLVDWLFFKLVS